MSLEQLMNNVATWIGGEVKEKQKNLKGVLGEKYIIHFSNPETKSVFHLIFIKRTPVTAGHAIISYLPKNVDEKTLEKDKEFIKKVEEKLLKEYSVFRSSRGLLSNIWNYVEPRRIYSIVYSMETFVKSIENKRDEMLNSLRKMYKGIKEKGIEYKIKGSIKDRLKEYFLYNPPVRVGLLIDPSGKGFPVRPVFGVGYDAGFIDGGIIVDPFGGWTVYGYGAIGDGIKFGAAFEMETLRGIFESITNSVYDTFRKLNNYVSGLLPNLSNYIGGFINTVLQATKGAYDMIADIPEATSNFGEVLKNIDLSSIIDTAKGVGEAIVEIIKEIVENLS